jgi:hypothetical protein
MIDTHKKHIKIAQYDSENGVLLLQITSDLGNLTELVVDSESFKEWMDGQLIQRCFPELDVETKELMISGMDPETQRKIFNIEEEW